MIEAEDDVLPLVVEVEMEVEVQLLLGTRFQGTERGICMYIKNVVHAAPDHVLVLCGACSE